MNLKILVPLPFDFEQHLILLLGIQSHLHDILETKILPGVFRILQQGVRLQQNAVFKNREDVATLFEEGWADNEVSADDAAVEVREA